MNEDGLDWPFDEPFDPFDKPFDDGWLLLLNMTEKTRSLLLIEKQDRENNRLMRTMDK